MPRDRALTSTTTTTFLEVLTLLQNNYISFSVKL